VTPVLAARSPHARLRPVEATIDGGFWAERRRLNRERLLVDGARRLEEAGALQNLRVAAGRSRGSFRGRCFHDSDVYKWLEAVGYEGSAAGDDAIELIEAAQQQDGYLNSYYQVARPGPRWSNLARDHELYCAGHLIQAGLAHARVRGDERLLNVGRRFADLLTRVFADWGTPGHPEVEMALVELYRHTGDRRYLELAQGFVDRRGRGTLQPAGLGSSYFQDRVPVRGQDEVEGHAVRALYLAAGVTDLYLETGEPALLAAMERQWRDMAGRKAYITGGLGAHHMDEAFGDAYELPPDRCYGETCAAIASIMWSWRMLLATGEARYADLLERTLYNGFIAGLALDGAGYSYVNPLHVRDDHRDPIERGARRQPWYECACCPPNVMRLLASLPHYLATGDDTGGLQIHQYMDASLPGVRMRTDYPWAGTVELELTESGERTIALRIPPWGQARVDGQAVAPGYVELRRNWHAGDRVSLELDMTPRLVRPHPKIDAVRGCAAIERGPLVHCVEGTVDDVRIDPAAPLRAVERPDLLGGIAVVEFAGARVPAPDVDWPYGSFDGDATPASFAAVPYGWWGNRGDGGMRVWIPLTA
jgi:DUF1680 family protein